MSLSEIAMHSEADLPSVQREVNRLAAAGIVTTERRGNLRIVSPTDNEVTRSLANLLGVTYGPVPMLRDVLDDIEQVSEAYVFGSYASRYAGSAGRVPNDIDVLVVTDDYDAYDDALERIKDLAKRIGKEINAHRVRPEEWNREPTPRGFLTTVKNSPMIPLKEAS